MIKTESCVWQIFFLRFNKKIGWNKKVLLEDLALRVMGLKKQKKALKKKKQKSSKN